MSISKQFILAGNAVFTIELPDGDYCTYKVEHVEANGSWKEAWFVKLLVGPDNNEDFAYLGKLNDYTGQMTVTAKSCRKADDFGVRLLNRVLARIWSDDAAAFEKHGYKVHHEGRCGKCGRRLTVPESVESGIGPECSRKMGILAMYGPGEARIDRNGNRYTGD